MPTLPATITADTLRNFAISFAADVQRDAGDIENMARGARGVRSLTDANFRELTDDEVDGPMGVLAEAVKQAADAQAALHEALRALEILAEDTFDAMRNLKIRIRSVK